MTFTIWMNRFQQIRKKYGLTLAIFAIIFLARLSPDFVSSSSFPAKGVTFAGVTIIFLLQGLTLPLNELARGMIHWQHHAFALSWNFVGYPIIACIVAFIFSPWLESSFILGIIYLGLLPTTVSSAVALTAAADGSVPSAVISTVLSNLIGVVITPSLALCVIASASDANIPVLQVFQSVFVQIVLPLIVGQLVRPLIPKSLIDFLRPSFRPTTNSIILLILYISFCQSFSSGTWSQAGLSAVLQIITATTLMLLVGTWLILKTSEKMHFSHKTKISAYFCSSQKTLAMGVPVAGSLLMGDSPDLPTLGFFLLPLISYHVLQLTLGAVLVSRWQHHHH